MQRGMTVVLVLCALLMGCSHHSWGPDGGREVQGISCNGTPPNQPGCYDGDGHSGWQTIPAR